MKKDLDWLTKNIEKDIDKASMKEINILYNELNDVLKKYDKDQFIKNIMDWCKKIFMSKREKCKYIFNDILEEIQKPNFTKKKELRNDLLEISNIHRSFLENLISLLESL